MTTFLVSPNPALVDYLGLLADGPLEKRDDFPSQIELFTLDLERTAFTYFPSSNSILLSQPEKELLLRHGSGIIYFPLYYEMEDLFGSEDASASESDEFLRAQWRVVIGFIEEFISTKMISLNVPVVARRASNKITQMLAFAQLGLSFPDSVVTNDAEEVDRFNRYPLVAKRLSERQQIQHDLFACTMPFEPAEVPADKYHGPPSLFQRRIAAEVEYRVFVFLDDVIAVEFDRGLLPGEAVDIHENPAAYASAREVELRVSHKRDCVHLVRHLGLEYAAIDLFIIDDRAIFLEVNPNGLWYWLPKPLAARVRDSFLRLVLERLLDRGQRTKRNVFR